MADAAPYLPIGDGSVADRPPCGIGTPRVAAIDWAMLETILGLGIVPVAGSELIQFRLVAVEPAVPPSVADLGLRGEPNFEMLRLARPDLIAISSFYEYQRTNFERIAPVFSMPVYKPGRPPYALAEEAALALGRALGRMGAAQRLVGQAQAELSRRREELRPWRGRPFFVISIGDSRHFRAFGPDSMFGDVLSRLGLRNAWQENTSYGAAAPVRIEVLARVPEAILAVVPPVPPDARRGLAESALWNALPAVQGKRTVWLDPVNHFGGLPAARRFARLLSDAITDELPPDDG